MNENVTATNEAQEAAHEQTPDTASLQAEIERLKGENAKLKNAQSNASADASKYKKELQARMTEQERNETQTRELIEQQKTEIAALRRAQTLAEQRAGYIGLGFDEANADRAATATLDGDFAGLMASVKDFLAAHDKAILADAVRQTPRPGAGGTGEVSADYGKMIAEAQSRGDISAVAYYTRLQAQEEAKQITNR